jgi:hypothetical protein
MATTQLDASLRPKASDRHALGLAIVDGSTLTALPRAGDLAALATAPD